MSLPPDDDDDAFAPDDAPPGGRRQEGAKGLLTEGLRKALQSGANALFTSDEGGKKPLGELRLPKEAMQFLASQAERGRRDLFRSARQEMRRVMASMDMRGELRRALVGLRLQVKAEITITEDDTQVQVTEQSLGKASKQPDAPGQDALSDAATARPAPRHAPQQNAQEGVPKGRRRPRPES